MRPFIEGGKDTVLLEKRQSVRAGDICLVRTAGRFVLHRVVAIRSGEAQPIQLMGDGNLAGYEYCTFDDVIGTVIKIWTPSGIRKPLTRGRIWRCLLRFRPFLLKVYRHTLLLTYNS